MFIPVVDKNQKPLMPTIPSRARKWIKQKKATGFWKKGVFCVRLNIEPLKNNKQEIIVGIDPGSKQEGMSIKSATHTYLNIQLKAIDWIKDVIETRRIMRRSRRGRNTPYKKKRENRWRDGFPVSTKARWNWKLRICLWLKKMFPIISFIVEDVKAKTSGDIQRARRFSPIQIGKKWFYKNLQQLGTVHIKYGFDTFNLRNALNLDKSKNKLKKAFYTHAVDAWVLANSIIGKQKYPDNKDLLYIEPIQFHRRQLHCFNFSKGGKRKNFGGTRSMGLKRGSLVKNKKYGFVYVGGSSKIGKSRQRISVHSLQTGKRLSQQIRVENVKFLCYNMWRFEYCHSKETK